MTTTTAFKPGDVFTYEVPRDNSMCREGQAIAVERRGQLVLVDTYWRPSGTDSDSHVLTENEIGTAVLQFNRDDFEEVGTYRRNPPAEWLARKPGDRASISSQRGLQNVWLIRKGSTEDLETQIANALSRLEDADEELARARRVRREALASYNALLARR